MEIFLDLGLNAGYYYLWADKRHVVFIETRPELTNRLTLMNKNPETLLKNLILYTSGVKYYKYNDFELEPEAVFEFPVYSSASELRMKMELRGR